MKLGESYTRNTIENKWGDKEKGKKWEKVDSRQR